MSPRARIIIASCCTTYLSLGVAGATLGPLLPELSGRSGIALSGAGLILSFYFLGGVVSRLAAGMLSDRYGAVPIVVGGLVVEACSAVVLTLSRTPALLYTSSFLLGAALGSGLLGAVLIAAQLVPGRSVALANLVNAFWGVGSFVGPALFSAISASVHTGVPVIWIAGGIAIVAIPLLLGAVGRSPATDRSGAPVAPLRAPTGGARSLRADILRSPAFWLFALILLFDVGTESTIGGWTAIYLHRSMSISLQVAALVVSGFYVSFSIGRIVTAGVGSRVGASWVLGSGIVLALGGMGLVSATPGHLIAGIAGLVLSGFGIAPIYPTITALVTGSFGARAGTAVGLTGSLGFIGGVVFPWMAGLLMPVRGAVASMQLAGALLVVVAVLSFFGLSTSRRRGASKASMQHERS